MDQGPQWHIALVNATFFQASGGSISFVKGDVPLDANADSSRDKEPMLLVYVNGSHEYAIFDPRESEEVVISKNKHKKIQAEEPGEYCRFVALFLNALFLYFTGYIFTSPAQPLLLAPVSQMVFCGKQTKYSSNAVITMPASYMLCSLCFQMLFAGFFYLYLVQKWLSYFFYFVKALYLFFSTNRLRFYLRRAYKTGAKERSFRCSIRPFGQALGNHIQRVVSCSPASHKTMLCILVIAAGETACCKRVSRPRTLSSHTTVGILASCRMEMRKEIRPWRCICPLEEFRDAGWCHLRLVMVIQISHGPRGSFCSDTRRPTYWSQQFCFLLRLTCNPDSKTRKS